MILTCVWRRTSCWFAAVTILLTMPSCSESFGYTSAFFVTVAYKSGTQELDCAGAQVNRVAFKLSRSGAIENLGGVCAPSFSFGPISTGPWNLTIEGIGSGNRVCYSDTKAIDIKENSAEGMGTSLGKWVLPPTGNCLSAVPRDAGRPDAGPPDTSRREAASPDRPRDTSAPDRRKPDSTPTGCSSSALGEQVFLAGMVGCAGKVSWANRTTLCGKGSHVCSAADWVAKHGTTAPTSSYWTDDNLNSGSVVGGGCFATPTGGTACGSGPMHVCAGVTDPQGNTCKPTGCGLYAPTPNQYFGGCFAPAAGALCCN